MVRPGSIYRIAVTVYRSRHPVTVRASIQRNGVEACADIQNTKSGIPETLIMRVGIFFKCAFIQ